MVLKQSATSQVKIQIIFQAYRGIPLANSILSFKANTVIEVRTSVISNVSSKGKTTLTVKERFLAELICRAITSFFFLQKDPVCLVIGYVIKVTK